VKTGDSRSTLDTENYFFPIDNRERYNGWEVFAAAENKLKGVVFLPWRK
jgi:hypothetical protein